MDSGFFGYVRAGESAGMYSHDCYGAWHPFAAAARLAFTLKRILNVNDEGALSLSFSFARLMIRKL